MTPEETTEVPSQMYERHQLCERLSHGSICFRAMRYVDGKFEESCHEHVPAHRISESRSFEVLRSLVALASAWNGRFVVQSHLNRRGGDPVCYPGFTYHTVYPEPGALRQYVSAHMAHAWFDRVLSKSAFRCE